MRTMSCALALLLAGPAWSLDLPRHSPNDMRVRYVTYTAADVVVVRVRRGVVTRLVLGSDERITDAGTGFASQCERDELEWCIRADRDTNQVWVKPREGATHNNLELATTKRDYSIRFEVLPDTPTGAGKANGADTEMYRVVFQYPVPKLPFPVALYGAGTARAPAQTTAADEAAAVAARLGARPVARNTSYSMQALGGGQRVAPSLVFDDGRFTFMRFPNSRELPAPFVIGADDQETRVNFHMEGDLLVLHKIAPRFVLRLGDAVVGIWNDAYDADGIATPKGVVVPDVQRELK